MPDRTEDALPPLLDPADALNRAGGQHEVAHELFGILQATLPETLTQLRAAHEAADLPWLRDTAHRLYGATLYCGVPRMRTEVARVEQLCVSGDRERLDVAIRCLLETIESTLALGNPFEQALSNY